MKRRKHDLFQDRRQLRLTDTPKRVEDVDLLAKKHCDICGLTGYEWAELKKKLSLWDYQAHWRLAHKDYSDGHPLSCPGNPKRGGVCD